MPAAGDEILDTLDATERGFVLGALLLHPSGRTDLTAGLEPPSDVRCAEALGRIAALPRTERVRLTGELARAAVTPLPAGIDAVDGAVLADLLREEPPEIVRLVARLAPPRVCAAAEERLAAPRETTPLPEGTPAPANADRSRAGTRVAAPALVPSADATSPVDRTVPVGPTPGRRDGGNGPAGTTEGPSGEMIAELQRAIFSRVASVHPAARTSGPPSALAGGLLALGHAELLEELTRRGAAVLALSLRGASRHVILRAAALAGPPWADHIAAACDDAGPGAAGTAPEGPELDRAAAVSLVAATAPASDPRETVTRVGARAAGARLVREGERGLGGAEQARAVAQRLPAPLGVELLGGAGLGCEHL